MRDRNSVSFLTHPLCFVRSARKGSTKRLIGYVSGRCLSVQYHPGISRQESSVCSNSLLSRQNIVSAACLWHEDEYFVEINPCWVKDDVVSSPCTCLLHTRVYISRGIHWISSRQSSSLQNNRSVRRSIQQLPFIKPIEVKLVARCWRNSLTWWSFSNLMASTSISFDICQNSEIPTMNVSLFRSSQKNRAIENLVVR